MSYINKEPLQPKLTAMPASRDVEALVRAEHPDPFSILGRENCTVGALRAQAQHVSVEPMLGMGGAKPVRVAGKPVTSGDINKMFADADAETAL